MQHLGTSNLDNAVFIWKCQHQFKPILVQASKLKCINASCIGVAVSFRSCIVLLFLAPKILTCLDNIMYVNLHC